jgi:hypothetical protein
MEPRDRRTTNVEAFREAWRQAAQDLGIRLSFSGGPLIDAHGREYELVLHIPDFGSEKGMAVLFEWDSSLAEQAATEGFAYTALGQSYETYDRQLFEETFNDWQWTGKGQPPPWYTGDLWSD